MLVGIGLFAACTTIIEESRYDGLEVGITKTEALDRLIALPVALEVHAALPRPAKAPPARAEESDIVRLAAASVGAGALREADRDYLMQYDLWYFEEASGERSVILGFAGGVLTEIHNRRAGTWFEAVF